MLLTSACALFPGIAGAADVTIAGGSTSTTQISTGGTDQITVAAGGTLAVDDTAIKWNAASTGLVIDNAGTIESTAADGRAINAGGSATAPRVLTLTNAAGATISAQDDAIRINTDITQGSVGLTNAGTIVSTVSGQAIDFDAVSSIAAGAITITNLAGGVIESTDADAIRPGEGAVVDNAGLIQAGAVTNTASDGIDFQSHSGTVINEAGGTIIGARHGITTDGDVAVTNYGTIIGQNGSGVGSDGTGSVTNYGTIIGAYNGSGVGDGDGVDIDGYATVYNAGTIEATGAAGTKADGRANVSEAIALSAGGVVYNDTGGVITGADVGITACCSATTTITNKGSIYGTNHGIGIDGTGTILNTGSIGSANWAIMVLVPTAGITDVATNVAIDNYGSITGDYGALLVQAGTSATLTMESGASLDGMIGLGGALDVITNGDVTFADTIAGAGSLVTSGSATLDLAGSDTLAGTTTVAGGTLRVSGSLSTAAAAVAAGGTLLVDGTLAASGGVAVAGTLGGNGAITGNVAIASGGTLAPGNGVGTLTVAGNVTLANGATTAIAIDGTATATGAGSYSRLVDQGTFTAAGTLSLVLRGITGTASNSYTPALGSRYEVITASAVDGTFATIAQPTAGLAANTRLDALYTADSVSVVVTPVTFATLGAAEGWNSNTLAVAGALDTVRASSADAGLFDSLYGLDAAGYGQSFAQMSGQIYADALQGFASAAHTALSAVRDEAINGGAVGARSRGGIELWTRYIHTRESPTDSGTGNGYSAGTDGFVAGVTLVNRPTLRLGVAGGYLHSTIASGIGASASGSGGVGYAYGTWAPTARFDLTAVGGFATETLAATRTIATADSTVDAGGRAHSTAGQFAADARFRALESGPLALYALAGIEVAATSSGQVTESASAGDLALTLPHDNWTTADGRLGGQAVARFRGSSLSVYANWLARLGDSATAMRAVVMGDTAWTVASTGVAASGVGYGASLNAQLAPRLTFQASYDGSDRGRDYHSDRFSAGLSLAF